MGENMIDDPLAKLKEWEGKQEHLKKISEQILEVFPDGIVTIDSEGIICLVNEQTEFMFGYHRSELLGQRVEMLIPNSIKAAHVTHRTGFFDDPKTRAMGAGMLLKGKKKNNTEFLVEIMLKPLMTELGQFALAVIRKPKVVDSNVSNK